MFGKIKLRRFNDLKIAIAFKILILSLLIFYVRSQPKGLSFKKIDQHLTQ